MEMGSMEKKTYITDEEREKCRKVAEAFAELEDADIVVVDAGRYGFVKLQYYTPPTGFENDVTFTDSRALFEDLWEEWQMMYLLDFAKGTPLPEKGCGGILESLPKERRKELAERKRHLAKEAGITL